MKKLVSAATAVALSIGFAGAASAQVVNQQVDINANVASKCGISAQQTSITLGDLTDANAKVRSAVTQEIATALNNARIIGFCNAPNSQVEVQRAVLARVGPGGALGTGSEAVGAVRAGAAKFARRRVRWRRAGSWRRPRRRHRAWRGRRRFLNRRRRGRRRSRRRRRP